MNKITKIEYVKVSDLQEFLNKQREVINKNFPQNTNWEINLALTGLIVTIENALK